MRGVFCSKIRLISEDILIDGGIRVCNWSRGHTDAAMVGPRIVVRVGAGGDTDVKIRAVLIVEDGVVEVVFRVDVVELGGP